MAKGPDAFRTISEAADEVGVHQHVLRFWETKFTFIHPMKRAGGRRFYRPADLEVLRTVRRLLHDEGYTIKGVQRLYKEGGAGRFGAGPAADDADTQPKADTPAAQETGADEADAVRQLDVSALEDLLEGLQSAKARLDAALG